MATLTITLSAEDAARLEAFAEAAQIGPEHLAGEALRHWLHQQQAEFDKVAEKVLKKNAELYRRLA